MQDAIQKKQVKRPKNRLSYKGAWKDRLRKFVFGSKEKEGAGKQVVVYVLLISIGFVS